MAGGGNGERRRYKLEEEGWGGRRGSGVEERRWGPFKGEPRRWRFGGTRAEAGGRCGRVKGVTTRQRWRRCGTAMTGRVGQAASGAGGAVLASTASDGEAR